MNNATQTKTLLAGLFIALSTSTAAAQSASETQLTDKVEAPAKAESDSIGTVKTKGPRHMRMLAEGAAIQAIGTAWYWRNTGSGWGESNRVDWQLGFKGSALVAKLDGSGWRNDGNPYSINALCHPMSGSLTYYLARGNGYSPLGAFVVSSLVSVSWELFTEYAEYGAPNDLLATSPAGFSIGESVYQIRHNWKRTAKQLSIGAGSNDGDGFISLGGRLSLDTLPTDEGSGVVVGGKKAAVGIEVPFDGAIRAVEAGAKSSVVGYYRNGKANRLFAGASSEFYFRNQSQRDSRDWDYMTTVSMGPTVDAKLQLSDATIDIGTDVYAEFGLLKSEAFESWRADHPMALVRNSMQDKADPYYYAYGVAVTPRINVAYRGLNVGGKVAAHAFKSMNGIDRDQEMMTADPSMRDTDVTAEAWLAYSHKSVTLSVDGRAHNRTGKIDSARGSQSDTTTMFSVAYNR
ncbi:MAG TPA: DUF3943 domain-containing protein [Kofleriaceae bacterium]|nr:DUF3943 domain-containing protein [Kofleriaceae bacterium]